MEDSHLGSSANDDGKTQEVSGDSKREAIGGNLLTFMQLLADDAAGSLASLDGSRSLDTPLSLSPPPSAPQSPPPPPPAEVAADGSASRNASSSDADADSPAGDAQLQKDTVPSSARRRGDRKTSREGADAGEQRQRRRQASASEQTPSDRDPSPAHRAPGSQPRRSRRRSKRREDGGSVAVAAPVLTHDEMLAAKLRELRDIVNMDVSEISEFLRHGPSVGKPPLPDRRGGGGGSSSGSGAGAKPRRRSGARKRSDASPAGAKHAAAETPSVAHSRSSSEKRRVKFSVPAIDVSRTSSSGRDEESALSGPPSPVGSQSPSDSSPTGDSSGGSGGGRFPKPHGSRSGEGAPPPGSRSRSSERRHDGDDRDGSPAPRRRSPRSAERALARDSDLRHAASADVRRWLRRKESSIRKMKREKRAEERQKERAAEADAQAQQERQRLAHDAMRAWMRKKWRDSAATAAYAPRGRAGGTRRAPPARQERSESCADGAAAGDAPSATTSTAGPADEGAANSCAAAVPPTIAGATKAESASSSLQLPTRRAGAPPTASEAKKATATPSSAQAPVQPMSGAGAGVGGGAGKAAEEQRDPAKKTPPAAEAGAPRKPSLRAERAAAAAATPSSSKVEGGAAMTGAQMAPKAAKPDAGGKPLDSSRTAAENSHTRRERPQSVPAKARNGARAHSATAGDGSAGEAAPSSRKEHAEQRVAGGGQRRGQRDREASAAGATAAAAADVGASGPGTASNAHDIKEPPKTAAGRKSYDEWLRSKILGRSSTSDSGLPSSASRASTSDELPAEVIRDAARRRLERIRRGRSPQQSARAAAAPQEEAAAASAGQRPASAAAPATDRRPFRWKAATGVLLEPPLSATGLGGGQPREAAAAASAGGAAAAANAEGANGATAAARRPRAAATERRRQSERGTVGGGGGGDTAESTDENPFRVPFPKLRRPRSSLERASFRGPEFASFVHKLVADDFRPEPQGSETPETVVEDKATKSRADDDVRRGQPEPKVAAAAAAAAPRRCTSPASAAARPPPVAATSELSLLDSDDIFALTSLQTQ